MDYQVTDKIPEGAVRVHMYNARDMLRPRGHMKKESIGVSIFDSLLSAFESWTDSEYGDSLDPGLCLCVLHQNMNEEINGAFGRLLERVSKTHPEAVKAFCEALP